MTFDQSTLPPSTNPWVAQRAEIATQVMLCVLWSKSEPNRAGEVVLLPPGKPAIFGRRTRDNGERRATLCRQRPGHNEPTSELSGRELSRRQLELRRFCDHVSVRNVGSGSLRVNGHVCTESLVSEGDVLSISGLLLVVCRRPLALSPDVACAIPRFGGPDAMGIVGESPVAWRLRANLGYAALREGHALIAGPSGSGKELAARALHALSRRNAGPIVSRNAATIPEGLAAAELFGNAANYPNPGMRARDGLVGAADRGTLFLDELGDLPGGVQTQLLRVLDANGEYHRLGESRGRRSEFRMVGATNKPLSALREDVLARFPLRVVVPPLSARREDIPLLVRHVLREMASTDPVLRDQYFDETPAGPEPRVTADMMEALCLHEYTSNVREIRRLLLKAMGPRKAWIDITDDLAATMPRRRPRMDPAKLTRNDIEACLERVGGVREAAWQELGLTSRFALHRLLKKHNLA